jgi:hypothetical protein
VIDQERFAAWLREQSGVAEPRRLVRRDADHILVSKFGVGFAARLHDAVARLPELFDEGVVSRRYRELSEGQPSAARVDVWHRAVGELLEGLGEERAIGSRRRAEVMAGVDSVAALLASILWSSPTVSDGFAPSSGEFEAYEDAVVRMDAEDGIFTRYYGTFDSAAVVNHCPGAPFGRRLVAQGWRICTGLLVPGPRSLGNDA